MRQQEIRVLGDIARHKQPVRDYLVRQCRNYRDAVNLCIEEGGYTRDQIASHLGMHRSSLASILNRGGSEKRRRYLDPDLFAEIQDLCGNTAISQYFEAESSGKLNRQQKGEPEMDLAKELMQQRELLQRLEQQLRATA